MNHAVRRLAQDRRCLVMGLGAFGGGLGVTRALVDAGAKQVLVTDLADETKLATSLEAINAAMKAAAEGELKGILGYNTEPLVSIDFNHNPASSTFDATQTQVVDGGLVRVLSWYDNEWGFSNRMSDTAALFGSL